VVALCVTVLRSPSPGGTTGWCSWQPLGGWWGQG
jgi:hypothetical protein